MLNVISLGAGVQSTTMALMAAHGEIEPMPDCAIFADTQAEPKSVYDHLAWLMSDNMLPFRVHVVTEGNLYEKIGQQRPTGQWKHMPLPAFIEGTDGRPSLANRSCTRDFKIDPIMRQLRVLLGLTNRRSPNHPVATQWIGISTDEAHRMKSSRHNWTQNRYPLTEARMSRGDCLQWLDKHGYPQPPKSSCTFCPFHGDAAWKDLRDNDPNGWAMAVEIDNRIRNLWKGRVPSEMFLHRGMKPLEETVFTGDRQYDLFGNECEGMCGV